MKKIGKLRTYTSKEIENSYVSIDFCCLDRDLFKAEMCYDALAKTGVKYARCQTGWAKTEKQKALEEKKNKKRDLIGELAELIIKENAEVVGQDVAEEAIKKIQTKEEGGTKDVKEKAKRTRKTKTA